MKLCRKCGLSKEPSEFYASTAGACKACRKAYGKLYREGHLPQDRSRWPLKRDATDPTELEKIAQWMRAMGAR